MYIVTGAMSYSEDYYYNLYTDPKLSASGATSVTRTGLAQYIDAYKRVRSATWIINAPSPNTTISFSIADSGSCITSIAGID